MADHVQFFTVSPSELDPELNEPDLSPYKERNLNYKKDCETPLKKAKKGFSAICLFLSFLFLTALTAIFFKCSSAPNIGSVCERCCFCSRDSMASDKDSGAPNSFRGFGSKISADSRSPQDQAVLAEFDEDVEFSDAKDLEIVDLAFEIFLTKTPEETQKGNLEHCKTPDDYRSLADLLLNAAEWEKLQETVKNEGCSSSCCSSYVEKSSDYLESKGHEIFQQKTDSQMKNNTRFKQNCLLVKKLLWKKETDGLMQVVDTGARNPIFLLFLVLVVLAWLGAWHLTSKGSKMQKEAKEERRRLIAERRKNKRKNNNSTPAKRNFDSHRITNDTVYDTNLENGVESSDDMADDEENRDDCMMV